ncbi:hypothetical protein ACQKMV_03710 [Lysinibacillus sp. NPDC094403]|uniref:hypothetical protein n=1 Tax=Lysinibacillus sp. NPDC094403 TaxID=3390581 RepID=UPI003D008381
MRQKLLETRAIEKVVLDLAETEEVTGTRGSIREGRQFNFKSYYTNNNNILL